MNIALVVFRFGPSHGSILQTYALTRILEFMGHKVTIIDRQRPCSYRYFKSFVKRVIEKSINGSLSCSDFYVGEIPPVIMSNLNTFIDTQLRNQTITITSYKKLCKIGQDNYDAFIVGSDQTWRPKYVYDIYNYFLDFVPEKKVVKRIAYAPSFGTAEWEYTPEQEEKCKRLARLFEGVSVREEDGVNLCKEHFGISALHVLDPTMLLTGSHYLNFVKKESNERYLGCNFLDFTEKKHTIAKIISNELKLPIRQLIPVGDPDKRNVEDRVAPSIENWLSGIANSEFTIVDSFHATVFCILFHKNFVTIANEARGLSRFTSLLKMFGLERRLVLNSDDVPTDTWKSEINWEDVDKKLTVLRDLSMFFLIDHLK